MYLEPGEASVYNAGVLISSVLDIVKNRTEIAIMDTSAEAHMPDVMLMPYRPHILGSGKKSEKNTDTGLQGQAVLQGTSSAIILLTSHSREATRSSLRIWPFTASSRIQLLTE